MRKTFPGFCSVIRIRWYDGEGLFYYSTRCDLSLPDTTAAGLNGEVWCMGDTSPKNQHKLHEQQQEKHEEKVHEKLENAVHQHHPDRPSTPEEDLALKKQEEAADAAIEKTE